jgi:hypothetical protein
MHAEIWSIRTNYTIEPLANVLSTLGNAIDSIDPNANWVVNMTNDAGPSLDVWYSPGFFSDKNEEFQCLVIIADRIHDLVSFTDYMVIPD